MIYGPDGKIATSLFSSPTLELVSRDTQRATLEAMRHSVEMGFGPHLVDQFGRDIPRTFGGKRIGDIITIRKPPRFCA